MVTPDQAGEVESLTKKLEPPATYLAPIHQRGNLSKVDLVGVIIANWDLNSHSGVVVDVEEGELLLSFSQDDEEAV